MVHYQDGQKYDAHHDWGFPTYNSRCLTLLLYLTDQEGPKAGGEVRIRAGRREGMEVRMKDYKE